MEKVKFGEMAELVSSCTCRLENKTPVTDPVRIKLIEWGQCSIPMIKMAASILGEDDIINTDENEEIYYEKLEGAGWDSNSLDWFMNFLWLAEELREYQG